jgi:hypothetical protein
VPCPTSGELSLADEHLDPGYRTIFASVTDVVGNRAYAGPYVVDIPPPPPPPASPVTISRPTSTVTIDGASRVRVGYREFKLAGVVRNPDAYPLAGASVIVAARKDGDAWRPLPSVTTDAHGRFSVTVPKGPSRDVRVSFGGSSQTVRVVVAAPVQLSSDRTRTRNGRTITFEGKIPEAGDGHIRVILQALARGEWVTFKTVGLRRGRFSARYRFTGTPKTTRYRFRAVVVEQPDLPYGAGSSSVLRVLVQPAGSGP